MKKLIIRLVFAFCVISAGAIISAGNCDTPSGGNGSGGGSGGDGSEVTFGKMKFTMADYTGLAKINGAGNKMVIKASQFPDTVAATAAQYFNTVVGADAGTRKKIFTVSLTGSTGGFLLAKGGELSEVKQFITPASADWAGTDADDKGIHVLPPDANGLKIYSVFAEKTIPNAGNAANIFAFTRTTDTATGTQPIFYCVAHAPKYTAAADVTASTVTFEGGQKADCYISSVGAAALGGTSDTARVAWLADTGENFKQSFQVTFAGIGTDDKAISEIGMLSGGDFQAKVDDFKDGLDATDMEEIVEANAGKSDLKVMTLEIVDDQTFTTTPSHSGGDGNGGDGNGGGGSGGDGNGGGGGTVTLGITIPTAAGGVAKKTAAGDEIIIKASGFPTAAAATAAQNFNKVVTATDPATKRTKIFDVKLNNSPGGLLLVGGGNLTAANQFSIPNDLTTPWADAAANLNKGIHGDVVATGTRGLSKTGLNIYSVFADKAAPNANNANGVYAFAAEGNTQPIFYCVATASKVTSLTDAAITTAAATTLAGGHQAQCYISSVGAALGNGTAWLTAAGTDNFKRSFKVTFAGISTDKAISEIGLTGANAAARVGAFKDGITTTEMGTIAAANKFFVKPMTLTIVNDTDFTAGTGIAGTGGGGGVNGNLKLTFSETDNQSVKIVGSEIRIKASQFPDTVAATAAQHFNTVTGAGASTRKKIFKVSLSGSTGGFLLAGGGNLTAANQFSLKGYNTGGFRGIANDDSGIQIEPPTAVGLYTYSVFADKAAPTANVFAFTPTTGTSGTQPIFYCVARAPKVTDIATLTDSAVTFEGGQEADCYISSVGSVAFGGGELVNVEARNAWLTDTGANFKQSFNIAFAGIGTDTKAISEIGLDGTDAAAKVNAFKDGITTAEMEKLVAANNSGYTNMTIKIVNDADFASDGNLGGGDVFDIEKTKCADCLKLIELGYGNTLEHYSTEIIDNGKELAVSAEGQFPRLVGVGDVDAVLNGVYPITSADDAKRGYDDISDSYWTSRLFGLSYTGAKAAMIFVARSHVTTNTIAVDAFDSAKCSTGTESNDNYWAASDRGYICRKEYAGRSDFYTRNYLGMVFRGRTNPQDAVRGALYCSGISDEAGTGVNTALTDSITFVRTNFASCRIGEVKNADTITPGKINNAWVEDANNINEAEFYAIGVNISDKTINEFFGENLAEFKKEMDNAKFRKLLERNQWADLRFKVKIYTETAFKALP